jgi:hypothetical protein
MKQRIFRHLSFDAGDAVTGWTWNDTVHRKRMQHGSMFKTAAAACRILGSHSKTYVSPTKARIRCSMMRLSSILLQATGAVVLQHQSKE